MQVFARHWLVPATLPAGARALLLEGSWPESERAVHRWSLDDSIDARYGWIDKAASELAETLGGGPPFARFGDVADCVVSLGWLNALSLRYYLVKLLRVGAFFDDREFLPAFEAAANDGIELFVSLPQDDDYVDLLTEIAERRGMPLRTVAFRSANGRPFAERKATPHNGPLRRLTAWCNERLDEWTSFRGAKGDVPARVILCGNPRILDPACAELLDRGCCVAWLYDRLAFGTLLKWRARGVRQLVCQSSAQEARRVSEGSGTQVPRLSACGLASCGTSAPIVRWLDNLVAQRGPQQSQLLVRIAQHFGEFRPTHLVLDEDATPMARAAIAVARRVVAPSIVVQHGAPRVRFAFAPPAADRICVWGESSRDQLLGWGVPDEQIVVAGGVNVRLDNSARWRTSGLPHPWQTGGLLHGRRILFYATVPPSDTRPDAVEYHLTTRTHHELVQMACAAVARIQGAELIFKLHPRCRESAVFESVARQTPQLRWRLVRKGNIARLLRGVSCVLNCGSSAGIEAAQCGVPVIELLHAGCRDLLPAADWGLFGSARSQPELEGLLSQALDLTGLPRAVDSHRVFARQGQEAAKAVVDAVLEAEPRTPIPRRDELHAAVIV